MRWVNLTHTSNKDSFYQTFSLSDEDVIRLLIEYRYKYDENYYLSNQTSALSITGASPLNQELIVLFADLDELVKTSPLSPLQLQMMQLIQEGYTYDEIEAMLPVNRSSITNGMRRIYKIIKQQNDYQWRRCIYTNTLKLKTKRCSHCKEDLPATDEFFTVDEGKIDMFHGRCKRCRNAIKKEKSRESVTKRK